MTFENWAQNFNKVYACKTFDKSW